MPRALLSLALALTLNACSGGAPAPSTTTTATPDSAEGGSPADSKSMCPGPKDGCMNEDNHKACLAAEAKCPGKVMTLESCPLQFSCE